MWFPASSRGFSLSKSKEFFAGGTSRCLRGSSKKGRAAVFPARGGLFCAKKPTMIAETESSVLSSKRLLLHIVVGHRALTIAKATKTTEPRWRQEAFLYHPKFASFVGVFLFAARTFLLRNLRHYVWFPCFRFRRHRQQPFLNSFPRASLFLSDSLLNAISNCVVVSMLEFS